MRKFIAITMTLLFFGNAYLLYSNYSLKKDVLQEQTTSTPKKKNFMSMMIETEARSGNYQVSTSNTWPTDGYVFNSELSKCENGSKLSWDETNKVVIMSGNVTDKCYVYFDVIPPMSLAEYVISQYTGTQGDNNIYYHNGTIKDTEGKIVDAEDNSYRFAGANPNNYVCFGSDEKTCPTENLYRIIGLIDGKIKLISADGATTDMLGTDEGYSKTYKETGLSSSYIGSGDLTKIGGYYWNSIGTNTWSDSTTNTTNLNKNFLAYLDEKNAKWKTMIADTTWYVGGMTLTNGRQTNAKTAYNYEVGANKDANTTVASKIGLMYVSDYYYGASSDYWTLPGNNSSGNDYGKAINDNWLCIGLYEWTLSRISDSPNGVFSVLVGGNVGWKVVNDNFVLHPSFNLTSSVKYESGDGTASSPIRLKL